MLRRVLPVQQASIAQLTHRRAPTALLEKLISTVIQQQRVMHAVRDPTRLWQRQHVQLVLLAVLTWTLTHPLPALHAQQGSTRALVLRRVLPVQQASIAQLTHRRAPTALLEKLISTVTQQHRVTAAAQDHTRLWQRQHVQLVLLAVLTWTLTLPLHALHAQWGSTRALVLWRVTIVRQAQTTQIVTRQQLVRLALLAHTHRQLQYYVFPAPLGLLTATVIRQHHAMALRVQPVATVLLVLLRVQLALLAPPTWMVTHLLHVPRA
jgi:hypothetical protein